MPEDIDPEQNTASPFLLKVWYVYMFIVMAGLYIIGVVSRDNSVNSYIVLGIIAILINPAKNIIGAIRRGSELRKEYEEQQKLKAVEIRNKQDEKERREQEKAKIMAAKELENRHAAKGAGTKNA